MGDGELVALAQTAGQAVVTAVATDAWGKLKAGIAWLLGRGNKDQAATVERRLEETRAQLAAAVEAELAATQMRLATAWQARLGDLLEDDPQAVRQLRSLLEQVEVVLPAGPVTVSGHGVAAGRDVTITAMGDGVAAGVLHGDVSPPGPTRPGLAG